MIDKFYVENIEKKQPCLQKEHKKILKVVYKNAMDKNCVKDYKFVSNICQCMKFTEINEETNLDIQVVQVCLNDLESLGFVINVMMNPNKEYSYAMTWLGLKYMEIDANNS